MAMLASGCIPPPTKKEALPPVPPVDTVSLVGKLPEGEVPLSLVWLVSPRREAQDVLDLLRKFFEGSPRAKLVVALDASRLSQFDATMKTELLNWRNAGRLELAMMPPGALPVPLLVDMKNRIARDFSLTESSGSEEILNVLTPVGTQRVVLSAAELWQTAFSSEPLTGIVAPLGYADSQFLRAVKAGNFPWVMVASSGSVATVTRDQNSYVYEAKAIDDLQGDTQGLLVVDEIYVLSQEEAEAMLLKASRMQDDKETRWVLVDLVFWPLLSGETQSPAPLFSHWAKDHSLSFIWGCATQRLYWDILAGLRETIAEYQNSGRADLGTLGQVWSDFYALLNYRLASAFRSTMALTPQGELADREFRANATSIHRQVSKVLKKPLPAPWLHRSLWEIASARSGIPAGATATAGVLAQNQKIFTDLYDSVQTSSVTDLSSLSLTWTDDVVTLEVEFSTPPLNVPMFEFYVDLNNRAYEGRGTSLNDTLHALPMDFWEYAVRVSSYGEAELYRYYSGGSLRKIAEIPAVITTEGSRATVKLPRSWIKGKDPASWGWALALWSEDGKILLDTLAAGETEDGVLFFNR